MKARPTEVIIVRHGETVENVTGTLQGLDPNLGRLTARGLAQAEAVGRALAHESFDKGYCSPLERAVLTLAGILRGRLTARPDAPALPLRFVDGLREMDMGRLSGGHRDTWHVGALRHGDERGDPLRYRAPGGESPLDLQHRVGRWFDHVMHHAAGGRILVVAHGGVVRALLTHALDQTMSVDWEGVGADLPSRNASVARLGIVAGRVVAATVDDTRHLIGLTDEPSPGHAWDIAEACWRPIAGR